MAEEERKDKDEVCKQRVNVKEHRKRGEGQIMTYHFEYLLW